MPTFGNTEKGPAYQYQGYKYYRSEEGKDFATEAKETEGTVFSYVLKLDETIQGIEKPDGTEQYPGKTCADLQMCHQDIESGMLKVLLMKIAKKNS